MPRKKTILSCDVPYHITGRTNNKEWFELSMKDVWSIMVKNLVYVSLKEDVIIHAFVLMNNHFHLLISTPKGNIDKVMYWFMKHTTLDFQKNLNRINKIYGGRYKWCLLRTKGYFLNALKYVFLNPVRAGIVEDAEQYEFSTLYHLTNSIDLSFKIDLDVFSEKIISEKTDVKIFLQWINMGFQEDKLEVVRKGLMKRVFSYGTDKSSGNDLIPDDVIF